MAPCFRARHRDAPLPAPQKGALRNSELAIMKADIDAMRAQMRSEMAEVADAAIARYSDLVAERDNGLIALNRDRTALHDAAMSCLPYWIVRWGAVCPCACVGVRVCLPVYSVCVHACSCLCACLCDCVRVCVCPCTVCVHAFARLRNVCTHAVVIVWVCLRAPRSFVCIVF